jgi:hypothetical protein
LKETDSEKERNTKRQEETNRKERLITFHEDFTFNTMLSSRMKHWYWVSDALAKSAKL